MGLTAGTGTALQHHEQGFSTRVSKTARKGQQRETVYPRLKPAKEDRKDKRGEREMPCVRARLSINTSYITSIIRST